jgi:hypothetical protein
MTEREPQTEQELAAYYYAHRDDPDEWEDPQPAPRRGPGRPSKGLSATITVRFTPDEAAIIYRVADEEKTTLSEVVRAAVRSLDSHSRSKGRKGLAAMNPADA